jgi:hypothetical protein
LATRRADESLLPPNAAAERHSGRIVTMRKPDLDNLLETAVAKALGVALPRRHDRRMVPVRKQAHPVRHAA